MGEKFCNRLLRAWTFPSALNWLNTVMCHYIVIIDSFKYNLAVHSGKNGIRRLSLSHKVITMGRNCELLPVLLTAAGTLGVTLQTSEP